MSTQVGGRVPRLARLRRLLHACLLPAVVLLACLLAAGCRREPPASPAHADVVTLGNHGDRRVAHHPARRATHVRRDDLSGTHWPDARLDEGSAWIACDAGTADNEARPVESLDFLALVDALTPCRERGIVRLGYRGNIGAGFTALVARVGALAPRMDLDDRILDLDSTGGQVEQAIRAGDAIAGAHWAIRVRAGSICHSACVLVLAAGDTRSVAGKVGIHRLMRDRSTATTRRELSAELADVTVQVRDYLARNGVAAALADQMMTIPNRDLRLLTAAELSQYGLSGTNAVQDDLERITLMRACGEDFVRRRDAFLRAFDGACLKPRATAAGLRDCGRALEPRFGLPDASCAGRNPMDERTWRVTAALAPARSPPSRTEPTQ